MENLSIIKGEYLGDCIVKVTFSDQKIKTINVGKFILENLHPQYNKYLDENEIQKFSIENGNIVWGENWDLDFHLEDIYSGSLS